MKVNDVQSPAISGHGPIQARREEILRRRAERLARVEQRGGGEEVVAQVAVVAIGEERFGIPAQGIRALVDTPPIAALPGLPSWLVGIAQVRGELLAVVHLGKLLGVATTAAPPLLVIVDSAAGPLGLLADRNLGFRVVRASDVADGFGTAVSLDDRPVAFVTNDLCAVLDLARLGADPRLVVRRG